MSDVSQVEQIFLSAVGINPAERAQFLDEQCGQDADLRQRVEKLLAAQPHVGKFLEPTTDEPTHAYSSQKTQPIGTVIANRYSLVEVIGEGGMGTVWRAKQTEPVTRYVALKLIKPGMDSKQVLARFEAERQALAMMDHPNIARILDGGIHDNRPFFVMELVKGTPITEFCDALKLTPQQRLELFLPVCQAIQHAHQKGIIHRDIKPSNVLIALYDDKPVPKVIDFGVAKATGGALTQHTIDTGFGGVVGTPQYMSPEQATFNNLDIDTRSDVYSLGTLLYELLAGSPPFAQTELEQRGLMEILRVVREEEPLRPSLKLNTAEARASISANRSSEPAQLSSMMKGEIDWIVMKALEKDRTRRYDTATALAKDVQRYLNGDAVEACPPTLGYRMRKAYRRNRAAVRVASAFVMLMLAAVAVSSWLAVKATRAEARAKEKRIEAEENAERADKSADEAAYSKGLADARAKSLEEELQKSSRTTASLQVDVDLAAYNDDSTFGLLRLAGTLKQLPTEFHELREFTQLAILCAGTQVVPLLPPLNHDGHAVVSRQRASDKRTEITLAKNGTVRLWDAPSAKLISELNSSEQRLVSCGLAPDGKTAYTETTDGVVRLWDLPAGTQRAQTDPRPGRYDLPETWEPSVFNPGIRFEGDRMLRRKASFAAPSNGPTELWNVRNGQFVASLDHSGLSEWRFDFLGNGRWVYSIETNGQSAQIFSAKDGQPLARIPATQANDSISELFSSPNGRWIVMSVFTKNGNHRNTESLCIVDANMWMVDPQSAVIDLDDRDFSSIAFITDDIFAIFTNNMDGDIVWGLYRHGSGLIKPTLPYTPIPINPDSARSTVHNGDGILIDGWYGTPCLAETTGMFALGSGGRLFNARTGAPVPPAPGTRYHPDLVRFAIDGRLVPVTGHIDAAATMIDTATGKTLPAKMPENYIPGVGFIGSSGAPVHFGLARWPDIDSRLLQLWVQVAVRGELGPDGEFVKWNEETWEQKRQELAAAKPPYEDFPFPGYVATDKLHWLRAEYEAISDEKEKLRLIDELLRRSETNGNKNEVVRWQNERAKYVSEPVPTE